MKHTTLKIYFLCILQVSSFVYCMDQPPTTPSDQQLQQLITILNQSGLSIVEVLKKYAAQNNSLLTTKSIQSLLGLDQTEINRLFLAHINDDTMRSLFLSMGADINTHNEFSQNCLFLTRKPHAITELIEHGADIYTPDTQGLTPLVHALENECPSEMIQILLINGAPADQPDKFERYPLHYALPDEPIGSYGNRKKICTQSIQLLLQHTANPNRPYPDTTGKVPLHCAVELGNLALVKMFLEYKAQTNFRDEDGRTPLVLAKQINQSPEIIRLLSPYINAAAPKLQPEENNILNLTPDTVNPSKYCVIQ